MVTLEQAQAALIMHEVERNSPRFSAVTDRMYRQGYTATAAMLIGIASTFDREELEQLADGLEREWITRWEMGA